MTAPSTFDQGCVAFLQAVLPQLRLRWAGFRRVRRQVCRKIRRRYAALGLDSFDAYLAYLGGHPEELPALEGLCRVTVSRFYRDRGVWQALQRRVLPRLAAAAGPEGVAVWSAGCASGEEPYTLAILWRLELEPGLAEVPLSILATEAEPRLLERARRAVYPPGCLRELPDAWRRAAFEALPDGDLRLRPELRRGIRFRRQDLRRGMPAGPFQLIFCRNLAFTYFAEDLQRQILARLAGRLARGGFLVLGAHETLPQGAGGFQPLAGERRLLQRAAPL